VVTFPQLNPGSRRGGDDEPRNSFFFLAKNTAFLRVHSGYAPQHVFVVPSPIEY
jgi:hypothetical protein